MVLSTGWGILALLIAGVCSLASKELIPLLLQDPGYGQTHGWPISVGLWVAAAIVWPLGRWLNRPAGREPHASQPGQPAERQGGGHTLFFVPMEYWAFFWLALGVSYLWTGPD
jgi:hypothetical protein